MDKWFWTKEEVVVSSTVIIAVEMAYMSKSASHVQNLRTEGGTNVSCAKGYWTI